MVLTSSPLSPSPFDQTLFLTHSDPNIHPLSVSSTTHTVVYDTEKEMLLGFREFLIKYDPDLLTGYDLCEEISEILDRAKDLNLPKSFPYLARPSSTSLKPRYPSPNDLQIVDKIDLVKRIMQNGFVHNEEWRELQIVNTLN
jgi:DNA polymerase elongation subunit (family B)